MHVLSYGEVAGSMSASSVDPNNPGICNNVDLNTEVSVVIEQTVMCCCICFHNSFAFVVSCCFRCCSFLCRLSLELN